MGWQTENNFQKPSLKAGMDCKRLKSENGCLNGMFWSETGSGFVETGDTPYSHQKFQTLISSFTGLFKKLCQKSSSKIVS